MSDDGARVVIEAGQVGNGDIVVVTVAGDRAIPRVIAVSATENQLQHDATLSSGGARLAYSTRNRACGAARGDSCEVKLWLADLPDGAPRELWSESSDFDFNPSFVDSAGRVLTYTSGSVEKPRVGSLQVDGDKPTPDVVRDDAIWAHENPDHTLFFLRRSSSTYMIGDTSVASSVLFRTGDPNTGPIKLRDHLINAVPLSDGSHVALTVPNTSNTSNATVEIITRDGREVARVEGSDETHLVGWFAHSLPAGGRRIAPPVKAE